jgi:hypothetical protein
MIPSPRVTSLRLVLEATMDDDRVVRSATPPVYPTLIGSIHAEEDARVFNTIDVEGVIDSRELLLDHLLERMSQEVVLRGLSGPPHSAFLPDLVRDLRRQLTSEWALSKGHEVRDDD